MSEGNRCFLVVVQIYKRPLRIESGFDTKVEAEEWIMLRADQDSDFEYAFVTEGFSS